MSVYSNRSRRTREDDAYDMVTDHLTTITRTRKVQTDMLRGATTEEVGPFVGRIETFRATRSSVSWGEKGTTATAAYILLALNKPALGATWTIPKDTFKLDDRVIDADGNQYRVTAPSRWDGNVLELNLELQG